MLPHPGHVRHLIMENVYAFRVLLDAGAAAHILGFHDEAVALNDRLLARTRVPAF